MRTADETWMLVSALLCSLMTALMINLIVPKFKEVFDNFGAELPLLTRLFVDAGWVLWLLPLVILVAWKSIRNDATRANRHGKIVLLIAIGVGAVLIPLTLIAMYLPIFQMAAVVGE